jgi:hypothetical protein
MSKHGPFGYNIKYEEATVSKGSVKDLDELTGIVKNLKKKFGGK